MSLKTKLATLFSFLVIVILIINNSLFYFSSENQLIDEQKKHMDLLAEEIGTAVEHSQYSSQYIEKLMGEKLRIVAIAAQNMLPKDIADVTNEQLVEISRQLDVSHITLFKEVEDDIVGIKSSDPEEINLSTKEWGYWFTAMKQLFLQRNVTIPEGQALPNYWTGPINVSTSNTDHLDKWGYYYDGTTNYIIDPYFRDPQILTLNQSVGPESIIKQTLKNYPYILEITGYNTEAFGKAPIYTYKNGKQFLEKENTAIQFGSYVYSDNSDVMNVREAVNSGQVVSTHTEINGREVLKTFVPLDGQWKSVVSIVTDYGVIQNVLNRQLLIQLMISISIILFVIVFSLSFADYMVKPIHLIVERVNQIAQGQYENRVRIERNDELGILSSQIDRLSQSLESYKLAEETMLKTEKLSIAGQLAAGVAHEIRNPLTSLKGFIQLMQKKDDGNKRYLDIMNGELDRIEVIVSELLVLAKPQAIQFRNIDISDILHDVIALAESHANLNNIQIHNSITSESLEIIGDKNQLKQVFINIVKNAIESMPEGGNLYITATEVGQSIVICFKDEGCGIPKEFITRIGEPFYTTKEKGTGLGLMVSNKIIDSHNGTMTITSEENKGTIVKITLSLVNMVENVG